MSCVHQWLDCNCITETLPDITLADVVKARDEGFQEGVKFAMAMLRDDTDLEPEGLIRVCFGCYDTEFLTDSEAAEKGWTADKCGKCDITKAPYFQKGLAPERKPERVGNIRI